MDQSACQVGTCGPLVEPAGSGSSPPYDVGIMGDPYNDGWLANPTKIHEFEYRKMTKDLLDFGFSPNGASPSNFRSSAQRSTIELLYTLGVNDDFTLLSAREVNAEPLVVQTSDDEYELRVYGPGITLSANLAITFAGSGGEQLTETTVYHRVPVVATDESILIFHNGQWIGDIDLTNTDGDEWLDVTDDDDDNDGFTDVVENYVGTDPLRSCGTDAWPPDFNNDQFVDMGDILSYGPSFNSKIGDANFEQRRDLNTDGKIDMGDILSSFGPVFNTGC